MIPIVSYGAIAISWAIRELRIQGKLGLLLIGTYACRVAVCNDWEVFSRVRKAWLQRRLKVLLSSIISWVTDGFIDILLSDVSGVNKLRGLLNCVSHDPLHEREGEIHCSAPASLSFPFSYRACWDFEEKQNVFMTKNITTFYHICEKLLRAKMFNSFMCIKKWVKNVINTMHKWVCETANLPPRV